MAHEQQVLHRRPRLSEVMARRWWVVALVAAVLGLTTWAVSGAADDVYEARAEAYLAPEAYPVPSVDNHPEQRVATVAELSSSSLALEQLSDRTGLSVGSLIGRVAASPVSGADVVVLTARGPSPEDSVELVTAMADVADGLAREQGPTGGPAFAHVAVEQPSVPTSPQPVQDAVVAALLGAVVAVGALWLGAYRRPTADGEEGPHPSAPQQHQA